MDIEPAKPRCSVSAMQIHCTYIPERWDSRFPTVDDGLICGGIRLAGGFAPFIRVHAPYIALHYRVRRRGTCELQLTYIRSSREATEQLASSDFHYRWSQACAVSLLMIYKYKTYEYKTHEHVYWAIQCSPMRTRAARQNPSCTNSIFKKREA